MAGRPWLVSGLLFMVLVLSILPFLAREVISNAMFVWALKPIAPAYEPTGAQPILLQQGTDSQALRARGIQRWLNGDIDGSFDDLWSAIDLDPSNERAFLSLMSFYSRAPIGFRVASRPMVLSGKWNLELESLSPLIVSRLTKGAELGHFLQYGNLAVDRTWSSIPLQIRGQSLGEGATSCTVYPWTVFWKDGRVLLEQETGYLIQGQFSVDHNIELPSETTSLTLRLSFDESCFVSGRKVRIDSVKLFQ